jgi:hypothetical protein
MSLLTIAPNPIFKSFFMAGFECSSHRRGDGRRLDILARTQHDRLAASDYRLVAAYGMKTVRDGVRWHLVENRPRRYDFASFLPMLRAARDTKTQVIWDLFHYGWPGYIDIWRPDFVSRFAQFAGAVANVVRQETDETPFYTVMNEISFMAWAGGDVGYLNPFARHRGGELKRILVRAAIQAIEAIRDVDPQARFVSAEPAINISARTSAPADVERGAIRHDMQFEANDLLAGLREPELGGRPDLLDIIGVNYYFNNQWIDEGEKIYLGDGRYRPFHKLLAETHQRYRRPIFIAETGTESGGRASWLHYVCDEVSLAQHLGTPVEGICLYPILNHHGWDDDRHCHNGLFCGIDPGGGREVHAPLAAELARQQGFLRLAPH